MAPLTTLPRVFKVILKILQKIEISFLCAEVANINIWMPFSFSHKFFRSSRMIYK